MFNYQFPAIKGFQANAEYYICMVPLKLLKKIFGVNGEYVPPQYRAQRVLNTKRIPEIKNYILSNRDSYVFSALAASFDGEYSFKPINDSDLGILEIDLGATFLINDGQHRKAAIIEAIEEDDTLMNESISIVFFRDKGLKKSQQMFTDLNKHAVTTTRSLNIFYESKEPLSILTKRIVDCIPFFDQYTDRESDNLGVNSPNLFTLSMFWDAIKNVIGGMDIDSDKALEPFIVEYWTLVEKSVSEWQSFKKKEISKKSLRNDYIIVYGVAILALGKLGNWLYLHEKKYYKKYISRLQFVDWRRSNEKDWALRALKPTGQIARSNETINLTYIRIKRIIGIELSTEEKMCDESIKERKDD